MNDLWIVTTDNLIQKINTKKETISSIDFFRNSKNKIATIQESKNRIWVSTYNGLFSISKKKGVNFEKFSKENGLPNDEMNRNAFFLLKDSTLVLGTINGFTVFDPKLLLKRNYN